MSKEQDRMDHEQSPEAVAERLAMMAEIRAENDRKYLDKPKVERDE